MANPTHTYGNTLLYQIYFKCSSCFPPMFTRVIFVIFAPLSRLKSRDLATLPNASTRGRNWTGLNRKSKIRLGTSLDFSFRVEPAYEPSPRARVLWSKEKTLFCFVIERKKHLTYYFLLLSYFAKFSILYEVGKLIYQDEADQLHWKKLCLLKNGLVGFAYELRISISSRAEHGSCPAFHLPSQRL